MILFFSLSEDASRLVLPLHWRKEVSGNVDGGKSFDKRIYLSGYLCRMWSNQDLPVTPGVVSPTNNSKNCNLGVVKDFNLPAVVADFICPNTICTLYGSFRQSVAINFRSLFYFYWDFGDGTYSNQKILLIYTQNQEFIKVKLVVSDTGSCNFYDTLVREILVLSIESILYRQKQCAKAILYK